MYNREYHAKKILMLKYYITEVDVWVVDKISYNNYLSE